LKRIESSTKALEANVLDIKDCIRASVRNQSNQSSIPPIVSVVGDEVFKVSLSAAFMKHAESSQPWSSIGVDLWIRAGRWWLLKVSPCRCCQPNQAYLYFDQSQMELFAAPISSQTISVQAYTDLIKASWILVDVIACHPQLSFLDSNMHYEVQILSAVSYL
jgi:hypothetical protein